MTETLEACRQSSSKNEVDVADATVRHDSGSTKDFLPTALMLSSVRLYLYYV